MELEQIVAFAISREIEAAEFYRELQDRVRSENGVALLKELESMERAHIHMLTEFNRSTIIHHVSSEVANLKISEFLTLPEPSPAMSFQDVLVLSMKREELSYQLYSSLADEADDPVMKKLFTRLAEEEARHKLDLEILYDDEIMKEN